MILTAHLLVTAIVIGLGSSFSFERFLGTSSKLEDRDTSQLPEISSQSSEGFVVNHEKFHTLSSINAYVVDFQRRYPNYAQRSYLKHRTFENRTVQVLKIRNNLLNSTGTSKKSIIVEAGMHAREWIVPASILYAIDEMLLSYSKGREPGKSMLEKIDWYFVPVANPDGYQYTQTSRYWRKNRHVLSSDCIGVDLNRNFDIHFNTTGVSSYCGADSYPGTKAFSEAESSNMRDLFKDLKQSLIGYLSVHNPGPYILIPWSDSASTPNPPFYDTIYKAAKKMSKSMKAVAGSAYEVGRTSKILYPASGASMDWALAQKSKIYAMTFELNPYSFVAPVSDIIKVGKELLAGLKSLSDEILEKEFENLG